METLYRRPLPAHAIAFSSPEGQAVFAEALAAGGLGGYFALAEQYQTQSDPAFCGLGSLVVALNALAIDPGRLWKGPWRWFSEELLDCCVSLDEVRARGVDLDTLACLARCNGADAKVVRPTGGAATLREALARASAGSDVVILAAYDRAALDQTGAGHFSPLAGWHAARDLVLVLDVARFKYPPHWVAVSRLEAAMRSVDPATGRSRGWIELRRRAAALGVALSLACSGCTWPELARRLRETLDAGWPPDASPADVAASLQRSARHCVVRVSDNADHAAAIHATLEALRATEAHRLARDVDPASADATAALLLLVARSGRAGAGALDDALLALDRDAARAPLLAAELDRLSAQSEALRALV